MIPNWDNFTPPHSHSQRTFDNIWRHFAVAWGWRCCLSLGRKRPGMLLKIQYFTVQLLPQGFIRPNMSESLWVGDPILGKCRDSLWRQVNAETSFPMWWLWCNCLIPVVFSGCYYLTIEGKTKKENQTAKWYSVLLPESCFGAVF